MIENNFVQIQLILMNLIVLKMIQIILQVCETHDKLESDYWRDIPFNFTWSN